MDMSILDGRTDGPGLNDLLEHARDAVRGGRLGEARDTCESLIEAHPEQPDAWFLSGMTALRNDDTDKAHTHLSRAVDMRRGFAPYRIALGQTLRRLGDSDGAYRQFHDAWILDPRNHEAVFGLAAARAAKGNRAEATHLQRMALRLLRRNVGRHFGRKILGYAAGINAFVRTIPGAGPSREFRSAMMLARWLTKRGDNGGAFAALERAQRVAPDDARPVIELGRQAFDAENFMLALEYLEHAHEVAPRSLDAKCEYGRVLSRLARHEAAFAILEDAHLQNPDAIRPLLLLGWARYRAGQSQRAISDFDAVLEQLPSSTEAHYGRARALIDAGELVDAKRWLQRCIALSPGHAGALRELANMKDLAPGDPNFHGLIAAIENDATPAQRRAVLHMAAGASCHNVKAYDDAFDHYRNGNLLKDVVFDITSHTKYIDNLIETFDRQHFERTQAWGNPSDVPVFILGMPRSGTSLVEQILASHSRVHGSGEREEMLQLVDQLSDNLNDSRPYPACVTGLTENSTNHIAERFLGILRRSDPHAARITDKMPGNFHHVGLIATLFPNAKIIHCQRDPRDTCLSIFFGDFVGNHTYSYNLTNLGRYHRQYQRLMAHWHEVLPGRILDVKYEDLVERQEDRSREMVAFCGLDWEARCLDFHKTSRNVRTRSNAQVRQPIYRSSIARWRPYAAHLEPLLAALAAPADSSTQVVR
ncbi:MAG: tetratricopeptide repeat protein [Rhodospirillaceae bacterium]|nr:tetratricopeptide repeat protein [Rhodospirillaceae bacterium]MBT3809093.1 tetratricopeptide repeat protein [Rhodospirillaceae bacterium]MBT4771368.1 tetratricopeptide repeat protein [Rhodospirillaceae bacterium]MBT5359122.1 tetratricopeptide repeat protein [Rhodospirillaceae bacterium]MBT5768992.1 tetratricopeptide repeat protein [Rhodospirillaceae bacterium]